MEFQLRKDCFTLRQATTLASQLSWLSDAYISDFFTKEYWNKVNPKWWLLLCQLEPDELASLLNVKTWKSRYVWPLSLLAYRSSIQYLSLENLPEGPHDISDTQIHFSRTLHERDVDVKCSQIYELEHCFRRHVKPKKQHEILHLSKAIRNLADVCNCHDVLDIGAGQGHLARVLAFRHGLNTTTVEAVGCHCPKAKQFDREVKTDIQKGRVHSKKQKKSKNENQDFLLSKDSPNHLTATVHPDISTDEFFKHISEYSGVSVSCGIVQDEICIALPKKQQLGDEPKSGNFSVKNNDKYHGYICDKQDCSTPEIKETGDYSETFSNALVDSLFNLSCKDNILLNSKDLNCEKETDKEKEIKQGNNSILTASNLNQFDENTCKDPSSFIMTGLHACGNLTATMIRMFVKSEQLKGLAVVGCCYMKLSTSKERSCNEDIGYPMSEYVKTLPGHYLNYEAMEMACHFIDSYHKRLSENSFNLHSHCYRAALQEIIAEKSPNFKHGCIKVTIKNAENMNFQQYAEKALCRLGLNTELSQSQLKKAEERLKEWKKVVAFYTLRLSLAPLLETIVLLDRVLYLRENGLRSKLKPIFDPLMSPRNFVLLAEK